MKNLRKIIQRNKVEVHFYNCENYKIYYYYCHTKALPVAIAEMKVRILVGVRDLKRFYEKLKKNN